MSSKTSLFSRSILFSYITKSLSLLVGILYTYIIARYLGPEGYGQVSYYVAFIGSIINISGIYFIQSLVNVFIAKSKSRQLFKDIIRWQYYIIGITFPLLYIFSEDIAAYLNQEEFKLLRYSAFLLLVLPAYDSLRFLFQGFKSFGKILKAKTAVDTTNLILAIILVMTLDRGLYGVIEARLVSTIIGIAIFLFFYRGLRFENTRIDTKELKEYSYGSFFVMLFKSLNMFIFTILIGRYISLETLGMFYIAQKAIDYSIKSFQTSINDVLVPFTSEYHNDKEKLGKYISYSTKASLIVTILCLIMIGILGKPLLGLLLPEYLPSYNLIILYGLYSITLAYYTFGTAFMSLNRMDILARIYLITLIANASSAIILIPSHGIYGAITSLIIGGLAYVVSSKLYLDREGIIIPLSIGAGDIKDIISRLRQKKEHIR